MNKRLASVLAAAALALTPCSVFAADYTPSASYAGAPTAQSQTADDGTTVDATTTDSDVMAGLEDGTIQLEITSWKDRNDADVPDEVTDNLNNAYAAMDGKTNEEIFSGLDEQLDAAKATDSSLADVTADDLKIADLFDVSLVKDGTTVVEPDGSVTLDLKIDYDTPFLLYHNLETGEWEYVPVTNLGNGVYEVTLSSLSPLAILVPSDSGTSALEGADTTRAAGTTTTGTGTETASSTAAGKTTAETTTSASSSEKTDADKTSSSTTDTSKKSAAAASSSRKTSAAASSAKSTGSTASSTSASTSAGDSTKTTDVDTAVNTTAAFAVTGITIGALGIALAAKSRKHSDK